MDVVLDVYRWIRRTFFRHPRPEGEYLVVQPHDVHRVIEGLGRQSFAPNWEQSYYERGEVLNLARIYYDERWIAEDDVDTAYVWWQTHVRGWQDQDGSLWLAGHDELEPTENPVAHLEGVGYDSDRGSDALESALQEAGIPYAVELWTSDADESNATQLNFRITD